MIRRNYNLAGELRKNERRLQERIRKRQKQQVKHDKLIHTDPIRLFRKIEKLEKEEGKSDREEAFLKQLRDDWNFIVKNDLHKEKVENFLSKKQAEDREREKAKRRLWGQKSIYFNPELNPLGKVPGKGLLKRIRHELPNFTKPLDPSNYFKYSKDPELDHMKVAIPNGEPPRFYKSVQNTQKPSIDEKVSSSVETEKFRTQSSRPANASYVDTYKTTEEIDDSDESNDKNDTSSDGESYGRNFEPSLTKRAKIG